MVALKLVFGDDIRRVNFGQELSYAVLLQTIQRLYNTDANAVTVKYWDEDHDLVTVACQRELEEAISVSGVSGTLKLMLVRKEAQSIPIASAHPTQAEKVQQEAEKVEKEATKPAEAQPSHPSEKLYQDINQFVQNVAPMLGIQAAELQSFVPPPQYFQPGNEFADMLNTVLHPPFASSETTKAEEKPAKAEEKPAKAEEKPAKAEEKPAKPFGRCGFQPRCGPFIARGPLATTRPDNQDKSEETENELDVLCNIEEPKKDEKAVHRHIICDDCGMNPIVGVRYKCTVCHDFDLCQNCEAKNSTIQAHHANHPLLKLPQPTYANFRRPFFGGRCGGPRANNASSLQARFVNHETIPEDTRVNVQDPFVKIWQLRNEGPSKWPQATRLQFVGGDNFSVNKVQSLKIPHAAAPGETVRVYVDMAAPAQPGKYIGHWRLCSPSGTRFGQRLSVSIIAEKPVEPEVEEPVVEEPVVEEKTTEVPAEEPTPTVVEHGFVEISAPEKPAEAKEIPVEAPKKEEPQSAELTMLLNMGFKQDPEHLQALLAVYENDVLKVVQELLRK